MLGDAMVIRFVGGPKDGQEYELPPIDAPLVIRVRSGGVVHVYEFLGDRSDGVVKYEYQGEQSDE